MDKILTKNIESKSKNHPYDITNGNYQIIIMQLLECFIRMF